MAILSPGVQLHHVISWHESSYLTHLLCNILHNSRFGVVRAVKVLVIVVVSFAAVSAMSYFT